VPTPSVYQYQNDKRYLHERRRGGPLPLGDLHEERLMLHRIKVGTMVVEMSWWEVPDLTESKRRRLLWGFENEKAFTCKTMSCSRCARTVPIDESGLCAYCFCPPDYRHNRDRLDKRHQTARIEVS
jgi:hypothetical protein